MRFVLLGEVFNLFNTPTLSVERQTQLSFVLRSARARVLRRPSALVKNFSAVMDQTVAYTR
ncbi:MAG: hypothetical protein DMF74_26310, partial [Acidobacteria bacterium]